METITSRKFEGVVTSIETQVSFVVDGDCDWIRFKLAFQAKGWYQIFIIDPEQKIRLQAIYIQEPKEWIVSNNNEETSFSTVPGEVKKGTWLLQILSAVPHLESAFVMEYQLGSGQVLQDSHKRTTTWTETNGENGLCLHLFNGDRIYNKDSKWYKGDFHTHTNESDGKLTPAEGMNQARKMGLDFFTITDHNILPTKWIEDELLTIPGMEITSSKGHFNAIGLTNWVDWRPAASDGGMETEEGMNRLIQECRSAGAIVSINHPMLKPWEWQFKETRLKDIGIIELWNDPTFKDNVKATEEILGLWSLLWNDGHQIYGIGGSDSHLLPTESYEENGPPSVIGDPATYVFADGLTAQSIIRGVEKGHVYLSRGPILNCLVTKDDQVYQLGDRLQVETDEADFDFQFTVEYSSITEPSFITWIENGEIIDQYELNENGECPRAFTWKTHEYNWVRIEVRSRNNVLLACTNPVYAGETNTTLETWEDLLIAGKDHLS
ncbi:CehA/McbA family metallohydrolase [Cytobacillus gottheilii]|uniref:CehA/McbA family metallohydrolase n=1 Tax=Cytobacillus gottheilii TaxID=859144 RepID=UPI0009B9D68A|nr:CehA/McbA family metallohydrolase [Cytobacillus gottheilii]